MESMNNNVNKYICYFILLFNVYLYAFLNRFTQNKLHYNQNKLIIHIYNN